MHSETAVIILVPLYAEAIKWPNGNTRLARSSAYAGEHALVSSCSSVYLIIDCFFLTICRTIFISFIFQLLKLNAEL